MRIWVVEIGETLPIEKNARLLRYGLFTRELANRYHHDITWWTSGFSHFQRRHVCAKDQEVRVDAVNLRIIKGLGYKSSVSVRRILHQKNFASQFSKRFSQYSKPDLVICSVPTIENAYWAVRKSLEYNIPVLIDIRDEWPDELVDVAPALFRPLVKFCLRRSFNKMHFICKNATGIIAVSKNFQEYALNFAGRESVLADGVFPLGYPETTKRVSTEAGRQWWTKIGVDEKKMICCFFGTIGNFFNLDTIIDVAERLNGKYQAQFVLCGSGQKLKYYKKKAHNLSNVIFPGFVDGNKISALMEMADIGLAPYAQGTKMSMPNKVFEYMAGGLPLVSSIQGEITQILEKHHCGITYDAESTEQLTFVIQKLYDHPDLRKQMGKNGEKLFLDKYTTEKIVQKFNAHICEVVEKYQRS